MFEQRICVQIKQKILQTDAKHRGVIYKGAGQIFYTGSRYEPQLSIATV